MGFDFTSASARRSTRRFTASACTNSVNSAASGCLCPRRALGSFTLLNVRHRGGGGGSDGLGEVRRPAGASGAEGGLARVVTSRGAGRAVADTGRGPPDHHRARGNSRAAHESASRVQARLP